MRRILLATAAFALVGAGAAMAADTASVEINAEQAPICTITDVSSSISLGSTVDVAVSGTFKYKCNFEGDPDLTFTSLNGGVTNGTDIATYGIYLNDDAPSGPPSTWLQSSNTPQAYNGISTSTPANTEIAPYFQVGLTQALPVAGLYSDTLTIDIAP